jgi:hypothetical protein
LTSVQQYKKSLLTKNINSKSDALTHFLPRFIWVLSKFHNDQLLYDTIYDGTSIYRKKELQVEYNLDAIAAPPRTIKQGF